MSYPNEDPFDRAIRLQLEPHFQAARIAARYSRSSSSSSPGLPPLTLQAFDRYPLELPPLLLGPEAWPNVIMPSRYFITFSQPGVVPPVYLVTNMSNPPWVVLEMAASNTNTDAGDIVYLYEFENVPEGRYQYKIRIGEDRWVVDESQETVTDRAGNINNTVYVDHGFETAPVIPDEQGIPDEQEIPDELEPNSPEPGYTGKGKGRADRPTTSDSPADGDGTEATDHAVESSEAPARPGAPVPAVILSEPTDRNSRSSRHLLHPEVYVPPSRAARRSSAGVSSTNFPGGSHFPLGPEEEQSAPLFAHEAAHPDNSRGTVEEQSAPLFLHETVNHVDTSESDEDQSVPLLPHERAQVDTPEMGLLDEESAMSSDAGIVTPPSRGVDSYPDELNNGPLLPHETASSVPRFESELTKMITRERALSSPRDELSHAPRFLHEAVFHSSASDDGSEFDQGPLLPHETDFAHRAGSFSRSVGNTTTATPDHDGQFHVGTFESRRGPTFPHEMLRDDTPSLRRGRTGGLSIRSASESQLSDATPSIFHYDSTTANSPTLSGRRANNRMFRRSASSNLPHRMPLSDAEDENLRDPSLEAFPTSRDQILERVATIGTRLPEDEAIPSPFEAHSPPHSVVSQAVSSVDLAPVSSHISLGAIAESSVEEVEGEDEEEGLPSPVLEIPSRDGMAERRWGRIFDGKPAGTPSPSPPPPPPAMEVSRTPTPAPATTATTKGQEASKGGWLGRLLGSLWGALASCTGARKGR